MLWQDSEKRKQSLLDLREVFNQKGYVQTSEKIVKLSKILDLPQVPKDFEKQWISIVTQFEQEFAQGVHAKFRQGCLEQIAKIILTAIKKIGKDFPTKLLEIFNLFHNLRMGKDTVGKIGNIIENLKDSEFIEERFYLLCFAYLIMVEGIFDDCVRILYFLWMNSMGSSLKFHEVKEVRVKDIKKDFEQSGFPLIFLRNWEEKNHLRNSIGHARFEFDSNSNLINFVDVNPRNGKINYNCSLSFNQSAEIGLEIEDTVEAFLFFFLMIKIRDFILSPSPYK